MSLRVSAVNPEDAQMALVLRPGMVFRAVKNIITGEDEDDGKVFLCVANMDWAVLAWPIALRNADGCMELSFEGKLHWHFVWETNQYLAAVAEPILREDHIVLKEVQWQPALVCAIGVYSADFVFRELVTLAAALGIENPRSFARSDLLREIAMRASGGDSEFAQAVVDKEASFKKKKKSVDKVDAEYDQFAEILLENMDRDEAFEFMKDMQVGQKKKNLKKKEWQQMRKDKLDAT